MIKRKFETSYLASQQTNQSIFNNKTMAGVLFEDIFDVKDIDPEGKKFDRGMFKERFYDVHKIAVTLSYKPAYKVAYAMYHDQLSRVYEFAAKVPTNFFDVCSK